MKTTFSLSFLLLLLAVPLFGQNVEIDFDNGSNSRYSFLPNRLDINQGHVFIGKDAGATFSTGLFQSTPHVFIGLDTGKNAGGSNSIGIGTRTLMNAAGQFNIGIGADVLPVNSSSYNIGIGSFALLNNQTGQTNIAIGFESLRQSIVTSANIAIGNQALKTFGITGANTASCLAIGHGALQQNQSGGSCVAIGNNALYNNLASFNLGIGKSALVSNTTGVRNVAIGDASINANNGDNNVAIGHWSYFDAKEAENSVAVGTYTADNDTIGANSVYIGYQAGASTSMHGKSGNVFIGHRAGYGEMVSNTLMIDNTGTSSPLIEGHFDTDLLEVNGALHAHGNTNIYGNMLVDGTINVLEEASFNGSYNTFYHGNSGSVSGVKLQNTNSNDSWRLYVSSSTGDLRLFNSANGTTLVGKFDQVTGAYTTPSDRRLKKEITLFGKVLPALMSVSIKSYKWKAESSPRNSIGVIAQEVKDIFPELVHYDENEDSYTVDYAGFSMVALKAIQEQQKIIEELAERIENLEDEK